MNQFGTEKKNNSSIRHFSKSETTKNFRRRVPFLGEGIVLYGLIAIFLFITFSPIVWIFSTSLKQNQEAMSFPPNLLPQDPTLENFIFVLTDPDLVRSLSNSFIV